MNIAVFFICAICSYLISGLNPAIILSKSIYKKDIRDEGSKNPGFTNFKRVFGMKFAWLVFVLDISKAIVLELVFGYIFGKMFDLRLFGIAYTGIFAMLGHAYPVWYKFKGGKGFLVCMTTLWILDWKAGLFAFILLAIFLFTTHLMSLSTIVSLIAGTVMLPFIKVPFVPTILYALCVVFMIYRHKENIKRLATGTEKKFYFTKKD